MMYGDSINFEKEFIQRTKENICALEEVESSYDVTQFINSMLGLLIIPKEKHYKQLEDSMIDSTLLRKVKSRCHPAGDLQYIVRRLRNAVSHGHLKFEAEKHSDGTIGDEIKRITFRDEDKIGSGGVFTAKLEVDLLKKFVLAFADAILML